MYTEIKNAASFMLNAVSPADPLGMCELTDQRLGCRHTMCSRHEGLQ